MAKRTAIIDIGSNSARMVVFEKSSRYAFHLIKEVKSRVRIGEGAYNKGGHLQEKAMQRAFNALEDFTRIISALKCTKTLCVATSALRDAPNASCFIQRVYKELNLRIRIIDGKEEAYFGAISSLNLLMPIKEATTIDIGGGSTELAKIEDGKIVDTLSLDIGSVRLKELFFDKKASISSIKKYITTQIQQIPPTFSSKNFICIGGTLRALSKAIMTQSKYPLNTVHGFTYNLENYKELVETIINSEITDLKNFGIRKDRYDTMREGCAIFKEISDFLNIEQCITNGSGVREGVFLRNLLRDCGGRFPRNFNLSVKSMQDRFIPKSCNDSHYVNQTAMKLFDALSYLHQIDSKRKKELSIAAKLYNVGRKLNFYQEHLHSFYFIINNLNFGFTHEEKVLIALLIKYHTKKLPSFEDIDSYNVLLPKIEEVNWLSFILSLAKCLNSNLANDKLSFRYENHTLVIVSSHKMHLARECIKKLVKPASFAITIEAN